MLVPKRSHVVSLIPKSRSSTSVSYLLRLYLVLYTSAPLVLYSNFVPRVTLSLSGFNSIGDEGAKALSAALKDSRLEKLYLSTLSVLQLYLVLFSSAPVVLYAVFVGDVSPYLFQCPTS